MSTPAPQKNTSGPAGSKRSGSNSNRSRSVAIALALGALVLMFYAATIVHMGGNVAAHLAK